MAGFDADYFHDEAAAYAFVEARVWANGRRCPHCGVIERSGPLSGQSTRLGTYKCYACRKPFTVKIGTIFEGSHIPLHIWLQAIFLLSSAKEPISANQLHRVLGISVKSALYLLERICDGSGVAFFGPVGDKPSPGVVAPGSSVRDVSGRVRWKHSASRIRLSHRWQGAAVTGQQIAISRAPVGIHFVHPTAAAPASQTRTIKPAIPEPSVVLPVAGEAAPAAPRVVPDPVQVRPRPVPRTITAVRPKSARGLLHSDMYLPGGVPIAPVPGDLGAGIPRDSSNIAYQAEADLLPSPARQSGLPVPPPVPEMLVRDSRESVTGRPLPDDLTAAMFEHGVRPPTYQRAAADALHLSLTPDIWHGAPAETSPIIASEVSESRAPIPEIRAAGMARPPIPPLPIFAPVQFGLGPASLPVRAVPVDAGLIWWIATTQRQAPVDGHGAGLHFPYPVSPRPTELRDAYLLHAPIAETAGESGFAPEAAEPQDEAGFGIDRFTSSAPAPEFDAVIPERPWQPVAFDTAASDETAAVVRIIDPTAATTDPDIAYPAAVPPPGFDEEPMSPSGQIPVASEPAVWTAAISAVAELDTSALFYLRTPITTDGYVKEIVGPDEGPVALHPEYTTRTCDTDLALGLEAPTQSLAMSEQGEWENSEAEIPLLPAQLPAETAPELVLAPVAVFAWQRLGMPRPATAIDIAYHANDNRGERVREEPPSPPPRFWTRARQKFGFTPGPALRQAELPPAETQDQAVAIAARATTHEFAAIPAPAPFAPPSAVLFRFAELSTAVGLMEGPVMHAAAAIVPAMPALAVGAVLHFPARLTEASEDWTASTPAAAWQPEGEFPAPSIDAVPGPGTRPVPQPLALEVLDYRPAAGQDDEYALAPALHDGEVLRREILEQVEAGEAQSEEELPAYLVPPLPFAVEDAEAPSDIRVSPPAAAADFVSHAESAAAPPEPLRGESLEAAGGAATVAAFGVAASATEEEARADLAAPLPAAPEISQPLSGFSLTAPAAVTAPSEVETAPPGPAIIERPQITDHLIAAPTPSGVGALVAGAAAVAPAAVLASEATTPRLDSPVPVEIPQAAAAAAPILPVGELPEIPAQAAAALVPGAGAAAAAPAELASADAIRARRRWYGLSMRQAAIAGAAVLLAIIAITAQQLFHWMQNGSLSQPARNPVTPNGGSGQPNVSTATTTQASPTPAPGTTGPVPGAPRGPGTGGDGAPPAGGPGASSPGGGAPPPQTPPAVAVPHAERRQQTVPAARSAQSVPAQPMQLPQALPGAPGTETTQAPGALRPMAQATPSAPESAPLPPVEMSPVAPRMPQIGKPMAREQQQVAAAQPSQPPSHSDVMVDTGQEQSPLRAHLGFDNAGLPALGRDRWSAGLDAGSEYFDGAGISYQYTSDLPLWRNSNGATPDYEMHSATVNLPLPWRDRLAVFGIYATAVPDLGPDAGVRGITWQASGRYILLLPVTATFNQQLQAGFDFKRTDNNLLFGGLQVFGVTSEIDQFSADYSFSLRDAIGRTSADGTLVVSPGGMSSGNTDSVFNQQQPFAQARYAYARLDATRLTGLPPDAQWVKNLGWLGGASSLTHIVGQWASNVLLPSEQLGIGGLDTVPGYNERSANGSIGILVNEELLTPPFGILRHFLPGDPGDLAQLSGFLAYGSVWNPKWQAGTENAHDLMSAGLGVGYNLGHYVNFHFVYGWQLRAVSGVPVAEAPKGGQLSEFTLTLSDP